MKKITQSLKLKDPWLKSKDLLFNLLTLFISFENRKELVMIEGRKVFFRWYFILVLFLTIGSFTQSIAQTMMPLPNFGSTYTGNVRGYWFTAPTPFIITGLRVPSDAGTGTQNIHVIKINDPTPVIFGATSSNFTTLAYIQGAPNNVVQNVNILVNAGDIIGVFGQSGTVNSYSVTGGPFPSTILGQNVTLNRLIYQGAITGGPAPNYSWETGTGAISRVELYYTSPTPCSGTVTAGTATSTAVNACGAVPFDLTLTGSTLAGGITYQWQSSPQGANIWTNITGATNLSYNVANQVVATDYRCIVTCTNSNSTQTSSVISVGQNPYTACYCTPTYSYACSNTSENINSFIIEGEGTSVISDLNTGCSTGNYQNRTSVFAPVDLLQDSEYGVQVNTNYSSAQYVWASLWIDFNDNGAFESSEQLIKDVPMVTSPSFLNLSITIPDTAPAGVHRMRVRANYNATVDACSNGSWGETHDYNVNVIAITCYRPLDVQLSAVTKNSALVTITDNTKNTGSVTYAYEVRESGKPGSGTTGLAASGTATTNPFPVSGLQPLTKYTVYVKTVCSSTDSSGWSKSDEVSTMCDYPTLIAAPGKTVCGPQEVDLTAIFDAGTVKWYDTVTKDSLLHTGANFLTPELTADTSYWVQAGNSSDLSGAVGDGIIADGGTWNFLYNGWEGVKTQYIYTADELITAGLGAGTITGLTFDVTNVGNYNPRLNFRIAIGETALNAAQTTFITYTSLTEVYNNPAQPLNTGLMTFTLDTPFVWDGLSNVVVLVASDNGAWGGTSGSVKGHSISPSKTTYYYADGIGIQGILNQATGTISANRANIIFEGIFGCASPLIEVKVTVEPKPAFELSSSTATSCEGGVSATPVTITTNLGGYDTFVWTPSTGVSGDSVNGWTFSTATEQEYVLSASQSGGICEHLKTVRVFAGKKPEALSTLASTYDLCKNEVQEMKALEALPASVSVGAGLGTTTSTSAISAFVQSAVYSKQQYIYSAAELLAQGLTIPGYITDLSFETINSGASLNNPKYTIKMMLTPNTSFGTTNFETGNFVTVFSKENHTHTFQGTQTMVFDSPFYWDGQSNILVEITQEGAGAGNNAETYFTAVTGTNVGMYTTSATDANPATGTRTTSRLNATFGLEQSAVTWSPTANLYLDAATTIPYTTGVNALTVYVVSSLGGTQVYNATLTAPSGCALEKPITVNVTDVVTPVVQSQTFCQATPVSSVVVTGAPTATYNFYNSATATTPITTISQTGTYYVEAVQGKCKSVRIPFTATVTPLGLPTAQFTQVVCGGGTVSALMASGVTGSQIKWYDSVTSTTPLAGTQPLVDNTIYYASQVLGACESGRVAVLVDINTAPAALTPQTISICGSLTYGSVNLSQIAGADLVWYPSATSQTPIPNTTQIVNGTYYVSQKVNGCESLRVQIIATAQGSVAAPTAGIQNICGSGTVAQLTAQTLPNATAEWYNSATSTTPLAPTAVLVNGTYYVSQRVGNCVSVKVPVAVRVISTSAPAVSAISMCAGSTVSDISLPTPSGVSYKWYLNSTSTTPLPGTDVLQSGYYFVTRVENGCESLRTQVQITVNSRPSSPSGATPQEFTDYAEISNLVMNEPNVVWYATYDDAMKGINPLSPNMPLVKDTTYYAVIIGANGCPSLPTPIEVLIVLGVNDFDLSKLNYYPNPVNDVLTITYADVITNVEVFDLNGRMVIQRTFDNQTVQLDFSSLSAGTYMLNVKTKENSQFIKIVKK